MQTLGQNNKVRNILLTGIPRSGTTLCCRLLNDLEGSVALVEPFSVQDIAAHNLSEQKVISKIASLVNDARKQAELGIAKSKLHQGQIADNIIAKKNDQGVPREVQIELGETRLENPLSSKGLLVVKHNAMFTALIKPLQEKFPIYALIRNPLSVLASWNTVALPVGEGRLPAGEAFCDELKMRLDSEPNILSRQLVILDWFFQCFQSLDSTHILRYENLIEEQHSALKFIVGHEKLKSNIDSDRIENQNSKYDSVQFREFARALLSSEGAYWDFYSHEDVEQLLAES